MFQKIKKVLMNSAVAVLLAVPVVAVVGAGAAGAQNNPSIDKSLCGGADELQLGSSENCSNLEGEDQLNTLITNVINIFSLIVGVIAVIMIIYGGFRYITSGGDSGNIGTAKNTILYAIIGLVIVALAQFIVRFVLQKATTSQ